MSFKSKTLQKTFWFDAPYERAWKDDDGKMRVELIVSDDQIDLQRDRVAKKLLNKFAKQMSVGTLPFLPNHNSTFKIGTFVRGTVVKSAKGNFEALGEVVLDDRFTESHVLFESVLSGNPDFQASIGGLLNLSNPKAVSFEEKGGRMIRILNDADLDHVAGTRKNHAANPRTRFVDAVVKAADEFLGGYEPEGDGDVPEWMISKSFQRWLDENRVDKNVVPFRTYPLNQEKSWSFSGSEGDEILELGGWPAYKAVHTFWDPSADTDNPQAPENKAAYKLPHHKVDGGQVTTFLRGVVAAGAALVGARGGADIPRTDRPGVARHLIGHYREFEVDPPESLKALAGGRVTQDLDRQGWIDEHEAVGLDISDWYTKGLWDEEPDEEAVVKGLENMAAALTGLIAKGGTLPNEHGTVEDFMKSIKDKDPTEQIVAVAEAIEVASESLGAKKEAEVEKTEGGTDALNVGEISVDTEALIKQVGESAVIVGLETQIKDLEKSLESGLVEVQKNATNAILGDITKAIESLKEIKTGLADLVTEQVNAVTKSQAATIEAQGKQIKQLETTIEKVANSIGKSQLLDDLGDPDRVVQKRGGVFGGVLGGTPRQAMSRFQDNTKE